MPQHNIPCPRLRSACFLIGGGDVGLQVAGMTANKYVPHAGHYYLENGEVVVDADKAFTTGAISLVFLT